MEELNDVPTGEFSTSTQAGELSTSALSERSEQPPIRSMDAQEADAVGTAAAADTSRNSRRNKQGRVVSNKMEKTIVVVTETRVPHPVYKKVVRISKRFKAHDENSEAQIGDLVRIAECRPLSKDKRWRLTEIVERAK